MTCISCLVVPSKCVLSPLTYSITPFTQNYQFKAYVVFSRPVSMTLNEFIQNVQLKLNGSAVRSNEFTAAIYNSTTYVVTFIQMASLNEMALSIGFIPGFIVDNFGNFLTVNNLNSTFTQSTGVDENIANKSKAIGTSTSYISWILLAVLLLFFLKSGYPVYLSI